MEAVAQRRDKRGRRIGCNWWRDHVTDLLHYAAAAWERECEAVALGYDTETAEYAAEHPRPTLKQVLLGHKGMNRQPCG